jgi:hypothetical protein
MQAPGFALAQDDPPMSEPGWESGITEDSRMEANEVLREHAQQARAAIQAQHEAGTLDQAAMERIKRDTRMQAANKLQSRLPADVYEEMFPAALDGSAL